MDFFLNNKAMTAAIDAANKVLPALDGSVGHCQFRAAWDAALAALDETQRRALGMELLASVNWNDKPDDLSEEVLAFHPCHTLIEDRWKHYERAMELVGNRRSKYSLVNLVNYLLVKATDSEVSQ